MPSFRMVLATGGNLKGLGGGGGVEDDKRAVNNCKRHNHISFAATHLSFVNKSYTNNKIIIMTIITERCIYLNVSWDQLFS